MANADVRLQEGVGHLMRQAGLELMQLVTNGLRAVDYRRIITAGFGARWAGAGLWPQPTCWSHHQLCAFAREGVRPFQFRTLRVLT